MSQGERLQTHRLRHQELFFQGLANLGYVFDPKDNFQKLV